MAVGGAMKIDWADLQFVTAVAREGTLTAAARALGVSQPTAGRRLAAFEEALGSALFERTAHGLQPTPFGRELIENLQVMDNAALAFARRAFASAGMAQQALTVACLDWVANWIVAPAAANFLEQYPHVALELRVDFRKISLSRHEADLAIRHFRFEQVDLVQKKIAELPSAPYASDFYIRARGKPHFKDGCAGHSLLTVHNDLGHISDHRWLRETAYAAQVAFRSNNLDAILRAAQAGAGLTVLPRVMGDASGLVRLTADQPVPGRDLWIAYHQDLRRSKRVAVFVRFLGQHLAQES